MMMIEIDDHQGARSADVDEIRWLHLVDRMCSTRLMLLMLMLVWTWPGSQGISAQSSPFGILSPHFTPMQLPTMGLAGNLMGQGFSLSAANGMVFVEGVEVYTSNYVPTDPFAEFDPTADKIGFNATEFDKFLALKELVLLFAVTSHELYHAGDYDQKEALKAQCPDQACKDQIDACYSCHNKRGDPCGEKRASEDTFWQLCEKAGEQEPGSKAEKAYKDQAVMACTKANGYSSPCATANSNCAVKCGSVDLSQQPPPAAMPSPCACP